MESRRSRHSTRVAAAIAQENLSLIMSTVNAVDDTLNGQSSSELDDETDHHHQQATSKSLRSISSSLRSKTDVTTTTVNSMFNTKSISINHNNGVNSGNQVRVKLSSPSSGNHVRSKPPNLMSSSPESPLDSPLDPAVNTTTCEPVYTDIIKPKISLDKESMEDEAESGASSNGIISCSTGSEIMPKLTNNCLPLDEDDPSFTGPMYHAYQEWALRTYGDSAKTKTVTRKKYLRIVKILKGEENSSVENSKFRFWVKAKGFKLSSDLETSSDILLVPCNKVQVGTLSLASELSSLSPRAH